jgi:hypothetical protein
LLSPRARSITVVLKNRKKNVLPFPKPPEELGTSTIIAQIGSERFAIHMQVEDLPPAPPPVVMLKRRAKKAPFKTVKIDGNNMRMETKFLRLRTPVELGSRFGDWEVCWLGGWSRHRLHHLVMLVRIAR